MINRKVLYGYQIQNGTLEIVPEEQRAVSMVFTLYNAGASYQAISDALNRQGIPYCREVPLWNKHKVKRLLIPVTPVRRNTPYWWKRIFSKRRRKRWRKRMPGSSPTERSLPLRG